MTCVHKRYDTRIFLHECKSLANNGYDVSLIVADGLGDEEKDGVKIYDVGSNKVGRLKRMTKITKLVKEKAIELDCQLYHFHDPELMFVGLHLQKMGKKVIIDMHEDHPGYIAEANYIPMRKLVSYLYEKLEIYAVKRFAGVVSTRQAINDRLLKYNKNISLVTNYPVLLPEIDNKKEPDIFTIAFAGAVVDDWRHKLIIKSLEQLGNVKYVLAGPVSDSYLNELKSLNGWEKVDYKGQISFKEVCEIYLHASIGVAIYVYCNNMGGKEGNLANTKMFEFMNCGIPFICTDFTLWKRIVEDEEHCGICVNPYSEEELINAIQYFISHPEERKQMGQNAREAAMKQYNWSFQERNLIDLYKRIL